MQFFFFLFSSFFNFFLSSLLPLLKVNHKMCCFTIKKKQTVSPEFWLASRKVHFYCHRFIAVLPPTWCNATEYQSGLLHQLHEKNESFEKWIEMKKKSVKLRCLWTDNFIYFFSHATFNIFFFFRFLSFFLSWLLTKVVNYFHLLQRYCHQFLSF